jgi:transcriptional regulator with XRE-family HTH domain
VLALHSRGLRQEEIAAKLGVNQSTVSRDLGQLRKKATRAVARLVARDYMFQFRKWDAGMDEVVRKAWAIADDEKLNHRVRIKALAFLVECYNSKLDTTVGGPDPEYYAWDHAVEIARKSEDYEPEDEIDRPQEYSG